MAKKEERSEDLNPRSKDVDEKIRQLMDPSVPDEPLVAAKETIKSKIKQVTVKEPIKDSLPTETEITAPELTSPVIKGRKIIVPVDHDQKDVPEPELEDAQEVEAKPVVKIAVSHDDETKEELAEKLDAAIADLSNTEEPEEEEEAEEEGEEATAPTLDEDDLEGLEEADEKEEDAPGFEPADIDESLDEEDEAPLPKPAVIEDKETDKAVKDIVSADSDELLEVEDALRDSSEEVVPVSNRKQFSLKKLFFNKKVLKLLLFLLVVGLIVAGLYPVSRYGALNLAGVRSSSSLLVLDASTQQPLKNVAVSLGADTVKTDANGEAKFGRVKLGKNRLKLERIAFAPIEKTVTVGWGSNPLGSLALTAKGAQYKLEISDTLSAKGIAGAEVETSDAAARSDDKGLALLTLPQTDANEVAVTIKASGYRQETIKLNVTSKETIKVSLIAARKHVFISKRSGKFDVYAVYVDGKDEKLLLAGSGNEKDDLGLLPHPSKDIVAYVSTRAGKKNPEGFVLSDLVLLDATNGKTTPIASVEKVQLVGWVDDRLVYVAITSGPSAATAQRNRLLSYNIDDNKTTELATSNYFNDLLMARGVIYFAPSSAQAGGTPAQFYQVNADGSNQKSLFNQEVWNILRTSYDHLALSVGQQWYDYALGAQQAKKQDDAPTTKNSRVYLDSPDGKKSLWIDQRDGKGNLLVYDIATGKDVVIVARSGLSLPMVWVDNQTIVFRVESKDEVADYVISLNGGEARKIRDVTRTGGVDNWYYY